MDFSKRAPETAESSRAVSSSSAQIRPPPEHRRLQPLGSLLLTPWAAPPAAAQLGQAQDRRAWVAGCSPGLPPPQAGSAHHRPLPPCAARAQILVLVWGGGRTWDAPAKAGGEVSEAGTLRSTSFPEFWWVSHCFVKTIPNK